MDIQNTKGYNKEIPELLKYVKKMTNRQLIIALIINAYMNDTSGLRYHDLEMAKKWR